MLTGRRTRQPALQDGLVGGALGESVTGGPDRWGGVTMGACEGSYHYVYVTGTNALTGHLAQAIAVSHRRNRASTTPYLQGVLRCVTMGVCKGSHLYDY